MRVATIVLAMAGVSIAAQAPIAIPAALRTQVVLLGTGSPAPDPLRSGPATAIVVNNTSYIVDMGPGLVRRAAAAAAEKGIPSLAADRLQTAFVTHLHSDHTVGYPDLIFTTWVQGRRGPLDRHFRRHEPERGAHRTLPEVRCADHEAYADSYRPADMPNWLEYRSKYHTTTSQLAEIAAKTRPGLLIVHHRGVGPRGREIPEEQYVTEIRRGYDGKVVVGHDLDVY